MTIDDANEELALRLPQRGPRTLAGLVFDELGRRPVTGDTVEVDGVHFLVEAMEGLRIVRLRITLPAEEPVNTQE
jgi:putative hemolysin